jgi:hypothetical protein
MIAANEANQPPQLSFILAAHVASYDSFNDFTVETQVTLKQRHTELRTDRGSGSLKLGIICAGSAWSVEISHFYPLWFTATGKRSIGASR